MPSQPNPNLLLIRRRYLGDVVLLGSVVGDIRRDLPSARITVLVEPPYASILKLNSEVNEIVPMAKTAVGWLRMVLKLRTNRYTHILDFDNRKQTAIISRITGAHCRIALHHGPDVCYPRLYTQTAIAPGDFLETRHIIAYYGRILEELQISPSGAAPVLTPKTADLDFVRHLPEVATTQGCRRILIHPGSRSPFRIWPAKNFAAICDHLQQEGLANITLVGGPGEQAIIKQIIDASRTRPHAISTPLTSTQLAALFSLYDLMICHDSGPMHVAAAVGTPVVALFGSQPITMWHPLGKGHVTLQAPQPCTHCVAPAVCIPRDSYHNYCVRNIPTTDVLQAITATLQNRRPA